MKDRLVLFRMPIGLPLLTDWHELGLPKHRVRHHTSLSLIDEGAILITKAIDEGHRWIDEVKGLFKNSPSVLGLLDENDLEGEDYSKLRKSMRCHQQRSPMGGMGTRTELNMSMGPGGFQMKQQQPPTGFPPRTTNVLGGVYNPMLGIGGYGRHTVATDERFESPILSLSIGVKQGEQDQLVDSVNFAPPCFRFRMHPPVNHVVAAAAAAAE
ncbi:hypothetical protein LguiB_027481 [Lonicera macranthoides]